MSSDKIAKIEAKLNKGLHEGDNQQIISMISNLDKEIAEISDKSYMQGNLKYKQLSKRVSRLLEEINLNC